MSVQVYEGVRILDFTQFQQGPVATQMLGDFGAEVIKIERPGSGDGFRGSTATGSLNAVTGGYSNGFIACNRNKKSVALNLKHPRGKRIVLDLAKVSDVVVANFRPGVMERLGLGYEDLSAINPRIICAYGTGYGLSGPDRDTLGQDMMAQCRGGLVRGNPPRTCGFNLCDQFGGMQLATGIMLALTAREKTGRGQVVDSNLLNTALQADSMGATAYLNGSYGKPKEENRPAKKKVGHPCYALYQAKNGKWVHIIDAFRDRPAERQLKGLGYAGGIAEDPRFADLGNLTQEACDELKDLLSRGVARLTVQEVVDGFAEQDMMAVPVRWYDEAFEDPQVIHNEMILDAEHPQAGKMKLLGFPIKLSETPATLRCAPPVLGEHNRDILGGLLGMSDDEIADLKEQGAVG
jgi:crotonobetainyl-CoA:carnitine CoA-transferase CaiB-like acyl-CoA transferase